MKIKNTKEMAQGALKFLIYAEPGAGKTSLARTIKEPTVIVSAEAGLLPLKDHDIDVLDISQDDEGNMIPKEKRVDRIMEIYKFLCTEEAKKKYKWVFIDSITEISQNMSEKLKLEFPDKKDGFSRWGEYSDRMRSMIKAFRDLPHYNVVMVALSVNEKDENARRVTSVDVSGKIGDQLPAYFDEVFYIWVSSEGERKLQTFKTDTMDAKDRSGMLDKYEVADLSVIAAKIRKPKKQEEKKKDV